MEDRAVCSDPPSEEHSGVAATPRADSAMLSTPTAKYGAAAPPPAGDAQLPSAVWLQAADRARVTSSGSSHSSQGFAGARVQGRGAQAPPYRHTDTVPPGEGSDGCCEPHPAFGRCVSRGFEAFIPLQTKNLGKKGG